MPERDTKQITLPALVGSLEGVGGGLLHVQRAAVSCPCIADKFELNEEISWKSK